MRCFRWQLNSRKVGLKVAPESPLAWLIITAPSYRNNALAVSLSIPSLGQELGPSDAIMRLLISNLQGVK